MITAKELIAFEDDIKECFEKKQILAPIHLYSNNERDFLALWRSLGIEKDDWVMCTWRSHYQCLCKGVPQYELKQKILDGESITLCFPDYKIMSSAIVGGILPIAMGTAHSIKRHEFRNKVVVFIGDMTAETGGAHECIKYAYNHKLPIKFVIEDNNKSVCTPTRQVWGDSIGSTWDYINRYPGYVYTYQYESKYPHAGGGERIQF